MPSDQQLEPKATLRTVTFGGVMGWLFGVLLVIMGLSMTVMDPKIGTCYLVAAAFALPPIAAWMERKTHIQMTGGSRALAVIVLAVGAPMVGFAMAARTAAAGAGATATMDMGAGSHARRVPQAAPAAATAEPETPAIDLIEFKTKPVEKNSVWTKYSYVLTIRNNTARPIAPLFKIKWTDVDKFVLDDYTVHDVVLGPHETGTFNGFNLINAGIASKVKDASIDLERL